jgi:hypothetical protein
LQKTPRLQTALNECQTAIGHRLPLSSFLLQPVQRLLRYGLLLREINSHLPKDDPDCRLVLDAMDMMQKVCVCVCVSGYLSRPCLLM